MIEATITCSGCGRKARVRFFDDFLKKFSLDSRWIFGCGNRECNGSPVIQCEEWQDIERTFIQVERVYSTRYDCPTGRREAA